MCEGRAVRQEWFSDFKKYSKIGNEGDTVSYVLKNIESWRLKKSILILKSTDMILEVSVSYIIKNSIL